MKKLYPNLLLLIVLIWSINTHAQLYPVQLTPVFNSPYSIKISDYATSIDAKMRLLINPTDISITNRQVRLKFFIQGNGLSIQSSDYIQGQPQIFINGGELQTLTNTDIAALFRLENLQGISSAQYANGLPEGMYSFCFELYDFVTNQKISQKSCTSLYLILNDPPLLNTPHKKEQIAASDFPNILFTWTPRQSNATNISYKFELKQLIDPTLDPQFAFQMSSLLYEETLFSTALLYNLNMPILVPGLRYAWRIKAISTTGLSENAVFKNEGYSEIYSFRYTQKCDPPRFALSETTSQTSVKITWQGLPDHTQYQVQYRKKAITEINKRGKEKTKTFEWFSAYSKNNQTLLTNLEPETTYEFKVGSTCTLQGDGIQSFSYSSTNTFTIPKKENVIARYNCGIAPEINILNQKILDNLIQSETFTAGDFPVKVLELKTEKSPYSGHGYIIVPYLGDTKIAVEFNTVTINTDYQLIEGVIETSYNPDSNNYADVNEIIKEAKGLLEQISELFDRANKLEDQKASETVGEEKYNKDWKEIYAGLENAHEQYKTFINAPDIPDDLKNKITDLDPVFVAMASNNYTTAGNQNKENLAKTNAAFEEVNKYFSEKCDASIKAIIAFLTTEKISYLKLAASEVSKNTVSIPETGKTYTASVYNEENGTLKITNYKNWSSSNPVQHLFLIETKDPELNKLKITKFWLSYNPNNVDGNAKGIAVVIYFKEPVPNQTEPFCTQKTIITKGVSTQAQFADAMEQMVFYSALGMGSVEALGGIKATECITGFTLDTGFQMGINAIVKRYLNESFTTKQLMQEVSIPSAATSCATAALVNQCGTACAGISGFVVGFGDDVLNQLKSGKSLSEVEISQSTLNGIKQGILNIVVQKVVTFGISKFSAWRGKYTAKQVEEALEDLQAHPEKYGLSEYELANLVNRSTKKFGEIEYEILVYNDRIIWKSLNNKELATWENSARLYGGELEFDFNTAGVKGIGQKWTDEAFETFGDRVKSIKVEWKTDSRYPNGESLGYKQFNEAFDETGDEILAIKKTLFYQTMEKRGYGIIQDYSLLGKSVVVKLKKK
jgi:TANFOR domain-containing protein